MVVVNPVNSDCWFVLFDIENLQIIKQFQLDIDEIDRRDLIQLVPSSRIFEVLRNFKEITDQNKFRPDTYEPMKESQFSQNFSVCIGNSKQRRIAIYEFEVIWTPPKKKNSTNYEMQCRLIAHKELITKYALENYSA